MPTKRPSLAEAYVLMRALLQLPADADAFTIIVHAALHFPAELKQTIGGRPIRSREDRRGLVLDMVEQLRATRLELFRNEPGL